MIIKKFLEEFNGGFVRENDISIGEDVINLEVFFGIQKEYSMYDLWNMTEIDMYETVKK